MKSFFGCDLKEINNMRMNLNSFLLNNGKKYISELINNQISFIQIIGKKKNLNKIWILLFNNIIPI